MRESAAAQLGGLNGPVAAWHDEEETIWVKQCAAPSGRPRKL